uniref:Transmembrane channel-like protein n=1 Tax=Podarcis muralis TaxID=64176 RepID=A0A670I4Y7_PODMU
MKEKRLLRQLRVSAGRDVSCWVVWRQRQSRAQKQFQEGIWNLVRIFQLWKPPLDEIGGNFGPGIQSYFTFLRFLLFINFLAVLLATGFILLPVIISQNTTIFPTGLSAGESLLVLPRAFNSYLFYGAYHVTQDSKNHYNVHLAYLLSILGYFFACLIWILRRVARWQMLRWEFKPCVSARIFTEWDFCIQSPEAATLKQRNIYNHLKIDLAEQIRHLQNQQRTRKQLAKLYLLRLLINGVILLLTGAAFYCIYAATEFSQGHSQKNAASLDVLSQYLPPVVISIVNVILPLLFHVLTQLEGYSPNTEVNLTLVRCVILKLSSLGMFMFFLGRRVLCIGSGGAPECHQCGYNKLYQCWETHIGQEMYKMTLFSFLTTLGSAFLISLPRRLIAKHSSCGLAQWLGKEEFLVPHNVLDIVAAQTVIWIGIFFCPLLPLLACVFVFFTFYIKKYTLFQNCQPSTQLFRASRSKFLFQIMLLLGLFQAYRWLTCGLFTNYSTPWEAVPKALSHLPMSTQRTLSYVTSNVFCFLLLMVLRWVLWEGHGWRNTKGGRAGHMLLNYLQGKQPPCFLAWTLLQKWCVTVTGLSRHRTASMAPFKLNLTICLTTQGHLSKRPVLCKHYFLILLPHPKRKVAQAHPSVGL